MNYSEILHVNKYYILYSKMPVDKFGHTDVGYSQRVIVGGVTLSQVNATFLRLDGTNAMTGDLIFNNNKLVKGLPTSYPPIYVGDEVVSWSQAVELTKDATTNNETVPANDKHLTNKKYVDDRDALKVSKAGDIMTGNLLLRIGSSHTIVLGCRDLNGNKTFIIHLGNPLNKIQCWSNNAIALISTHGFLFKLGDNIIRFGKSFSDIRIHVYQDIVMNEKHIVDLHDLVNVQDAATKNYVDTALTSVNPQDFATKNYVDAALNSDNPQDFATKNYVEIALGSVNANPLKKCHVGYIPNLERDVSDTGFVVSAISSTTDEYRAYGAFNTLKSAWIANSSLGLTAWLTIKCNEPVIIWRIGLKPIHTLNSWCLSASNDGFLYVDLLRSTERLVFNWDSVPKLLVLSSSSTTPFQYYKIDITGISEMPVCISYMQLYVYDT